MRRQVIAVPNQFVVFHHHQLKFRGVLRIHALAASTPYLLAYQLVANVRPLASLDGIQAYSVAKY